MRSLTASASRTYLHGLGTTTRDALDAVDLPTGRRLWRYEGDTAGGRALAADDAVYLADDKTLLSLDAATGRVRWQTPLNHSTAVFFGNGLVLAGNVLVVSDRRGDGNSIVRGLDSESGTERWSLPPGGQASPTGPITADQLVYVSAEDGSTSAYDVTTGAHRWSLPERPNALLAARGNDVYVDGATSVQSISGP